MDSEFVTDNVDNASGPGVNEALLLSRSGLGRRTQIFIRHFHFAQF